MTVWRMKHAVTSTVQAAKEWQQKLRLPTTPSGGTCMTACTLQKSQKASSSLSRLTKKMSTLWWREEFLESAARKIWRRGTGYRGDNTCQKKWRGSVQPQSRVFLRKSFLVNHFWGRRPDGFAINEALQIGYILEFKLATGRDEWFIEVKEAEANEQHKSIIGALKAAALDWEFEQINFVVGNRGFGGWERLLNQAQKAWCTRRKKRQARRRPCETGMWSAQSGDCFLPPAGARDTRPTTEWSRENIAHSVYVWGDRGMNTRL